MRLRIPEAAEVFTVNAIAGTNRVDDEAVTDPFPTTPNLMRAKPVFTSLPGWNCDIRDCAEYEMLPENAKHYVDFLEQQIGFPITLVSTGTKRSEITHRSSKL